MRFTMNNLGLRFVIAFALVSLTWNPSALNYSRWAVAQWSAMAPLVLFVGLVLLVAWVVFLRATARSLGMFGILLGGALAGSILWIIVYYGWIDPANRTTLTWIVLAMLSAILAAGMSWSHLRRRWSGQADVDDVDDVGAR
jgi:uncharacterized membrane-anchored protein